MSLTMPSTRQVPLSALGSIDPVHVLYEAEQPIVYTVLSASGDQLLAYVADETPVGRYIVLAPCGRAALAALQRGGLAVRDALTASWMWLALLRPGVGWVDARAIEPSDLQLGYLPAPGTFLLPQHLGAAIAAELRGAASSDPLHRDAVAVRVRAVHQAPTAQLTDRLTAILALPIDADWKTIVESVRALVMPDTINARNKAIACEAWGEAHAEYVGVTQAGVTDAFERWWSSRP